MSASSTATDEPRSRPPRTRTPDRLTDLFLIVTAIFGAWGIALFVALHAFFGSTSLAALAVKLGLIRFRPALAYTLAPWLGWYIAVAFVVIWFTSAYAFFTGTL